MQVELILLFLQAEVAAAREVPYPKPNQGLRLDAFAQDDHGQYAIELKVESANNSGVAVLTSAQKDIHKIAKYPPLDSGARWVVAIAYSEKGKEALQDFSKVVNNNAIYRQPNSIGILVVDHLTRITQSRLPYKVAR